MSVSPDPDQMQPRIDPVPVEPILRRLTRRVRWALFLGAFADATLVLAASLTGLLLVAQVLGIHYAPASWWWGLFAVPLVFGIARAWLTIPSRARFTQWLDRYAGFEGLLLTSLERDATSWNHELARRVQAAGSRLPALRANGLIRRTCLPLLLLMAVLLLPPPAPPPIAAGKHLIEEALASIEDKIELSHEEGKIEDSTAAELATKLKQLRDGLEAGESITWSDVDALEARLGQEESLHAGKLAKLDSGLASAMNKLGNGKTGADATAELAELLGQAAETGLLAELPDSLLDDLGLTREELEKLRGLPPGSNQKAGTSELPASMLALTPEQRAKLMKALAQATAAQLGQLADPGLAPLSPATLAELAKLGQLGNQNPETHKHGPG